MKIRTISPLLLLSFLLSIPASLLAQVKVIGDPKAIVYDIAFSQGGTLLAATKENTVSLYEVNTGKLLKTFEGIHTREVNTVALSPDSSHVLSGGKDGLVTLWNVHSTEPAKVLIQHQGAVTKVMFSQDGKFLFSAGTDKQIFVYDLLSDALLYQLQGHKKDVLTLALSPDGKTLASGGADRSIRLWDLQTGKLINRPIETKAWVRALAFSKDKDILISAGDNARVTFSNIKLGKNLHSLRRTSGWILGMDRKHNPLEKESLVFGGTAGIIQVVTPVGGYRYKVKRAIHSVRFKPKEGTFITLAVATRGKGVLLIKGADMAPF